MRAKDMKVYIQTDLEGVAGVVFFENRQPGAENQEHRRRMRRLLTGEVDAAARAAFDAGASQVVINDNHGSCYNILFEDWMRVAEWCMDEIPMGAVPSLDSTFDALVLVGMHAMGGTPNAVLGHTRWYWLTMAPFAWANPGMAAAVAGSFGVPAVFISGDDRVAGEMSSLVPGIATAAVKQALGPYQAQSRMPPAAGP